MNYSEILIKIRSEQGWTQKKLAERLGISQRQLSDIELKVHAPSRKATIKIRALMGELGMISPQESVCDAGPQSALTTFGAVIPHIEAIDYSVTMVYIDVSDVWPGIQKKIDSAGLSATDVANMADVSKSTVKHLVDGNRQIHERELVDVIRVAWCVGAPIADIFKARPCALGTTTTVFDNNGDITHRERGGVNITHIGAALDVQAMVDSDWQRTVISNIVYAISPQEGKLLSDYSALNEEGKQRISEDAEILLGNPRFTRRDNFENSDTTPQSASGT